MNKYKLKRYCIKKIDNLNYAKKEHREILKIFHYIINNLLDEVFNTFTNDNDMLKRNLDTIFSKSLDFSRKKTYLSDETVKDYICKIINIIIDYCHESPDTSIKLLALNTDKIKAKLEEDNANNNLIKKGEDAYNSQNYHLAINYFKQVLKKCNHKDDNNLSQYYLYLAYSYKYLDKITLSLEMTEEAIKSSTQSEQFDCLINGYNNLGELYEIKKNYNEALKYYEKSLEELDNHPDLIDLFYFSVHKNIGNIYSSKKEFTKAFEEYDLCLKNLETSDQDSVLIQDYIDIYDELGSLFYIQNDFKKSIMYYEKSINYSKNNFSQVDINIAITYCNLGDAYRQNGWYPKATATFEKALDIFKNKYQSTSDYAAKCYYGLGIIDMINNNFEEAISNFEKSENIYINNHGGKSHENVANCYHNLAEIYYYKEDYLNALKKCNEAIEIKKITSKDNRFSIANSYHTKAKIYLKQKNTSEALKILRNVLDIYKHTKNENDLYVADTYVDLGNVYLEMSNNAKAYTNFKEAEKIYIHLSLEFNPNITPCYIGLGNYYFEEEEYLKALDYYEKANGIHYDFYSPDNIYFAYDYTNFGNVYSSLKEYTKALDYYEKALEIYRNINGDYGTDVALTYSNIGDLYFEQNEYNKATIYFRKALKILSTKGNSIHANIALIYFNLGMSNYYLKNYSTTLTNLLDSWKICHNKYGDSHPTTQKVKNSLSKAYVRLYNNENFESWLLQQPK